VTVNARRTAARTVEFGRHGCHLLAAVRVDRLLPVRAPARL